MFLNILSLSCCVLFSTSVKTRSSLSYDVPHPPSKRVKIGSTTTGPTEQKAPSAVKTSTRLTSASTLAFSTRPVVMIQALGPENFWGMVGREVRRFEHEGEGAVGGLTTSFVILGLFENFIAEIRRIFTEIRKVEIVGGYNWRFSNLLDLMSVDEAVLDSILEGAPDLVFKLAVLKFELENVNNFISLKPMCSWCSKVARIIGTSSLTTIINDMKRVSDGQGAPKLEAAVRIISKVMTQALVESDSSSSDGSSVVFEKCEQIAKTFKLRDALNYIKVWLGQVDLSSFSEFSRGVIVRFLEKDMDQIGQGSRTWEDKIHCLKMELVGLSLVFQSAATRQDNLELAQFIERSLDHIVYERDDLLRKFSTLLPWTSEDVAAQSVGA